MNNIDKKMEAISKAAGVLCSPWLPRMPVSVHTLWAGEGFGAHIDGLGKVEKVSGGTTEVAIGRLADATRSSILSEKERHPVHAPSTYDAALALLCAP